MKKELFLFMAMVFFLACSGNTDKQNDSSSNDELPEALVEEVEQIESATENVNKAADDLAAEVDSLLNNL